jgi:hypothetical protein
MHWAVTHEGRPAEYGSRVVRVVPCHKYFTFFTVYYHFIFPPLWVLQFVSHFLIIKNKTQIRMSLSIKFTFWGQDNKSCISKLYRTDVTRQSYIYTKTYLTILWVLDGYTPVTTWNKWNTDLIPKITARNVISGSGIFFTEEITATQLRCSTAVVLRHSQCKEQQNANCRTKYKLRN